MTRVEGITALRAKCQRTFEGYHEQPFVYRTIRRVSIYLTWLLLHTSLSANGVTLLAMAAGVLAGVLFGANLLLPGAIVLLLSMVLDFGDGEVARYRRQPSKEGEYLDLLLHFCVNPAVFAGLAIGAHQLRPSTWVLVAGAVCTIAVFLLVMVTYVKWFVLWTNWRRMSRQLRAGETRDAVLPAPAAAAAPAASAPGLRDHVQRARRALGALVTLWDFPYIFLVVAAGAVLQGLGLSLPVGARTITPVELVLAFYAVTYPALIGALLAYTLRARSVTRDFHAFVGDLRLLAGERPAPPLAPRTPDAHES